MKSGHWSAGVLVALLTGIAMTPLILSSSASSRAGRERSAGQAASIDDGPKAPEKFDLAAIDDYVARYAKSRGFPGLSLAIARNGEIVLAKGYGKASLESGAPVTVDTAFGVGSVTKQFTCAAAYLLAEDGKLSLEDKVAKYYPALARAGDITLDDLGAHESGYVDYYPLDFTDERMRAPIAADDLIARYAGTIEFEPRSRSSYSNTGFVILGRAVEKAGGVPLATLLRDRIFKPLGMTTAAFERAPGEGGDVAQGYEGFALGDPRPAPPEKPSWMHAAGAISASARDIARWDIALVSGKVLKDESYRRMTAPHTLTDGRMNRYGCGLSLQPRGGETLLEHGGEVNGFITENVIIPRTKSAVVVMVNRIDVRYDAMVDEIVGLLLKADQPPPPAVAGLSSKEAARAMFVALQEGKVDRSKLGHDYDVFLTDEKIREASAKLASYGAPTAVETPRVRERGGLEVSSVKIKLAGGKSLDATMFRAADGKIEQFLIYKP